MLLPVLCASESTHIRKIEVAVQVKLSVEVLLLYIDLGPEQKQVVYFYFLFAVPDQERFRCEGATVLCYRSW